MKRLAIIGASYLQEPLIQKAKSMGIETCAFAWETGDVGEKSADTFYPISIIDKAAILQKCKEIGIDGICSIASDLAMVTVNYVAEKLGLVGNTIACTELSTNKYKMRNCFETCGDPSPRSQLIASIADLKCKNLVYPLIVKPTDRSGSRGVTKVEEEGELEAAIERAKEMSFEKRVLVEEFAEGLEYSVECISWKGIHKFLAITKKYTTGAPGFVEKAHLEPAPIKKETLELVKAVVFHALDSLEIQNGASHSELKITNDGKISLIEIGGRMGGDCIGSDLVKLSTGIDFVKAVIEVALGYKPEIRRTGGGMAAVRFVFSQEDIDVLCSIKRDHPEILVREDVQPISGDSVTDSSARHGYYLMKSDDLALLSRYLPKTNER